MRKIKEIQKIEIHFFPKQEMERSDFAIHIWHSSGPVKRCLTRLIGQRACTVAVIGDELGKRLRGLILDNYKGEL